MKKTLITLSILILISSMLSAMFFFSSGLFDMEKGYVTIESGNKILNELNSLPFIYIREPTEIVEFNELKSVSIDTIKEIKIESVSVEVIIEQADSENASFYLVSKGQNLKLLLSQSSNKLKVEVKYPRSLNLFGHSNSTLYIKIPKDFLGDLLLDSVSGDVIINDLSLNECDFDSVSGKINLKNIYCNKSKISTTSGDINIVEGNVDRIDSVSGEIILEDVLIKNDAKLETVSGDVKIKPLQESSFLVNFDSISGEFSGQSRFGKEEYDLYIETISGDLRIVNFI